MQHTITQRGVDLPFGCKDLIDLLPPGEEACFPVEGLAHIESHLERLMQSPSRSGSLWIYVIATPVTLGLYLRKGALHAHTFVSRDRQRQVNSILNAAGIQPTQDYGIKGPPFTHLLFFALTTDTDTDTASATRIVSKLLRAGFGLPENVHLKFEHNEKIAARPGFSRQRRN